MKKIVVILSTLLLLILFSFGTYSAINYEEKDEYYKVVEDLQSAEVSFEYKWANVQSQTPDLYDGNKYIGYETDEFTLKKQKDIIKTLLDSGAEISSKLNDFKNNVNSFKSKWNNYFSNLGKNNYLGNSNKSVTKNDDDDDDDLDTTNTTKKKKKKKTIKAPEWMKNATKYASPTGNSSGGLNITGASDYVANSNNIKPKDNFNFQYDNIAKKYKCIEINDAGELITRKNCWKSYNSNWYYFGEDGYAVEGEQKINGKRYYFYTLNDSTVSYGVLSQGAMAHDTVFNGYAIGSDGVIK